MNELTLNQLEEVSGGFHINLGTAVFAAVAGFVTGGPVGAGIALCGVVGAQGINNLEDMYHEEHRKK